METAHAPTLPRSHALTLLVLAGFFLGLAALTRPVAQALLPLLIFAVVLQPWRWRARLLGVAMLCLGYGVVVGPWLARNHAVHGVASISSGLGDALFARTHRHDKGFQWRDRGEPPADPRQALIRQRVFELAGKYEHEVEVRGALQAELGLNDVQGDTALREAASQVIRQQPLHWAGGSLRFFGEVWRDFDKPLDVRWEMSTKRKHVDTWPEPIRPLLAAGGSRPDADQAAVERLTELYQDYNLGAAITALFILGAVRCLSGGWRSGAAILPIVVVGQLLLYVALDGPLVRYRYAVQPLITLIAAGGLTWGVGLAWRAWAVRIAGRSWPPAADVPDSAAAGGALTPTLSQRERGPAPSPSGRGLG
jgi:hypothetical protein